ncbi:Hypothetical protein, putative [Bodo saltans]|uniref:Uncharacterized protein n=1 Tax=Bodo saltans TaxID=75058 RepID=A0A0S4JNP2_BODSA|nr:Hypothetical protein, putative [Bodo saltans]|eukprot:CUG91841.1 Hypothetical protein, putative [Bodo saltans]
MDQFTQPLEGIFRDGIPAPVLRALAPLYQAIPSLQKKVEEARDCYYWRANPMKCLDHDVDVVTAFMQASEASFRLCPQQSSTLLKCHLTEPAKAMYFCRDEEWEWRSCVMDKTGTRFWPYANAPVGATWSNGGQTEDFHLEDRFFYENFSWWRRKAAMLALRHREMEVQSQRKHWLANGKSDAAFGYPEPTLAPAGINMQKN